MVRVLFGNHAGRTLVGCRSGRAPLFVDGVGNVHPHDVDEVLRMPGMTLHPNEVWPPRPPADPEADAEAPDEAEAEDSDETDDPRRSALRAEGSALASWGEPAPDDATPAPAVKRARKARA